MSSAQRWVHFHCGCHSSTAHTWGVCAKFSGSLLTLEWNLETRLKTDEFALQPCHVKFS